MNETPSTELRFDGRVAVVTGAGRGLGRSYALLLAARGAKVVVNDPGGGLTGEGRDPGPAEHVAAEITAAGGDAVACTASVATREGGEAIIQTAVERYGGIDILIHNAGNVRRASLKEMSYEDFDAVLDVHLRGAFHVVRPAFPLMCRAGYGRIVLTSSIGGLYGNHGVANYAAAKAGVIGLANVAALEGAADGVACNVIVPAAVTRMADGIDISAFTEQDSWASQPATGATSSGPIGGSGGAGGRRRKPGGLPALLDDRRRRPPPGGDPIRGGAVDLPGPARRARPAHSLQLRIVAPLKRSRSAAWLTRPVRSPACE